ncbi:aldo-keto reductase [Stachybotrys elegans]|uniref:Aldo-keto reductase n=1 Tax=Stachybotrys elegans TaxID=80388 RepID=A0A8K0SPB8_9HYPO|nr:aldo-keto reductase [Stachybotrys elegans]
MNLPPTFSLNNGLSIPAVGLGTFQGDAGNSQVKDAVLTALRLGYRHIDGASAYGNEKEIGQAIRESGIPRGEIFPADVEKAIDGSLQDLGLNYVPHAYKAGENNITIRHPNGNGKPVIDYDLSRRYTDTWKAMERLVDLGKARSIGLSNFNMLKTGRILDTARIIPAVNQVELHPYLPQHELLSLSREHGILLMAHQPRGGRPVGAVRANKDVPFPTEDPKIQRAAHGLGITPAQVCLSWAVQRGVPVVPKSNKEHHMTQNLHLKKLPQEIFELVDGLSDDKGPIRFLDPTPHLGFDIFDEEQDQPVANSAPWD